MYVLPSCLPYLLLVLRCAAIFGSAAGATDADATGTQQCVSQTDVPGIVPDAFRPDRSLDWDLPAAGRPPLREAFEAHWTHLRAGRESNLPGALLALDEADVHDIAAALSSDEARQQLKLAKRSVPVHCQSTGADCLRNAIADGGTTIIVDGAELVSQPVFLLVRAWKRALGMFVHCNLYLTPSGTQGLGFHSDKTDVFILQLQGEKEWDVCHRIPPDLTDPSGQFGEVMPFFVADDNGVALPLDQDLLRNSKARDAHDRRTQHLRDYEKALYESCRRIRLKRGDTLYLPAGIVHRARSPRPQPADHLAQTRSSLHLTVGVARTHHRLAWGGLLANMLTGGASMAPGALDGAGDDEAAEWIHMVASGALHDDEGFRDGPLVLARLPRNLFNHTMPTGFAWSWNKLALSVDGLEDLPVRMWKRLRAEFRDNVLPVLNEIDPSDQGDRGARAIQTLRKSFGDRRHRALTSALLSSRRLMQRCMPPLAMASTFAKLGTFDMSGWATESRKSAKAAAETINATTTRARRTPGLYVFLDPVSKEITSNLLDPHGTTHTPPIGIPDSWNYHVRWWLGAFTGARGRAFTAETAAKMITKRTSNKHSFEVAGQPRVTATGKELAVHAALTSMRWLIEQGLLEVVDDSSGDTACGPRP